MKLAEALEKVLIPEKYSIRIFFYKNKMGDSRVFIKILKGEITDPKKIKSLIMDVLPDADYNWSAKDNNIYSPVLNCENDYKMNIRIIRA